jgi:hypothetical protein
VHHRIVVPVGRVGDIDDDLGAVEDLREALAGERVDARVG